MSHGTAGSGIIIKRKLASMKYGFDPRFFKYLIQ
jgi:hypothetical protein